MSSKKKNVTYKDPTDENTDYLVPLQYEIHPLPPNRSKPSEKSQPPSGGIFGAIFFPLSLVIYGGVPIVQFVIGLIYVNQCTIQQLIAVWMIVSGVFGMLLVGIGLMIYLQINRRASESSYDNPKPYSLALRILVPIFVLLLLFDIAWYFAGQVFVFEVKTRVEFFDSTLPEYCHGNLYKAAYILIFIDYLIFLAVILLNVLSCISPQSDSSSRGSKKSPAARTRK